MGIDYIFTAPRWKRTTVAIDLDCYNWARTNMINISRLLNVALSNLKTDYENGDSNKQRSERMLKITTCLQHCLSWIQSRFKDESKYTAFLDEMNKKAETSIKELTRMS